MPLLPEPRITNAATNFLTGQDLGRTRAIEDIDRQTQMQAGQLAASGDMQGAKNAFFKGGQFDRGLATQNAIQKMSDDNLQRTLQVQDRLARLASTIQTPEEFEMAKTRLKSMGLPISDKITFEQLPQLRAEALSVADQMTLAMKEREMNRKSAPSFEFTERGVGNKNTGAFDPYPAGVAATDSKKLTAAAELRKEFNAQSKDFQTQLAGADRVAVGARSDSAQGDMALVYGFMKMLDPTSVVREGEFATAENSGGIPQTVMVMYNKALSGERLTPAMRQSFMAQADAQIKAARQRQNATKQRYVDIASRNGFDPQDIITEFAPAPGSGEEAEVLKANQARLARDASLPESASRTETVKATEILNKPSPFKDYPNAKQAPDGHWYIDRGGKFFRIDQ